MVYRFDCAERNRVQRHDRYWSEVRQIKNARSIRIHATLRQACRHTRINARQRLLFHIFKGIITPNWHLRKLLVRVGLDLSEFALAWPFELILSGQMYERHLVSQVIPQIRHRKFRYGILLGWDFGYMSLQLIIQEENSTHNIATICKE